MFFFLISTLFALRNEETYFNYISSYSSMVEKLINWQTQERILKIHKITHIKTI